MHAKRADTSQIQEGAVNPLVWWGKSVLCLLAAAGIPSADAVTPPITGAVTNSVTWSGTNLLQGTITIAPGVLLTIDPGSKLLMDSGATILVRGQLLANGTESRPIHFTRAAPGRKWKQIQFVQAADSHLRHCVFEYADSAGTHLDYYDNDCDAATPGLPRTYHEAIVAVATRLQLEGCTFRYLPDDGSGGEGDAVALISDDPQHPGPASAEIRGCQFLSIGQGVHSRYSSVLIEDCFFTGHNGDNDDVDLYGESEPPPIVRRSIFLNPNHDDMINPTRCSAIIEENLVAGSDDHGIVLRDKCAPVVRNNVIVDCNSAGIAVQNQCRALLLNNTIVNCGRGIRFFDHTDRRGPPYCLAPGSGTADIINCIIWDCPTPLHLTDSPFPDDRGSHATVLFCNVEGGRTSASVSANSTLQWGAGNIDANPKFSQPSTNNFRLLPGSPCIDAGTNAAPVIRQDLAGVARPLDGDGDGRAAFDIGAFEHLLAGADSNADGIPDGWCQSYGFSPIDPNVAAGNADLDAYSNFQEWVADTDPTDALSFLGIAGIRAGPPAAILFSGSAYCLYTLYSSGPPKGANAALWDWTAVPGQTDLPGTGGPTWLTETNASAGRFYRISVRRQ